MWILFETIMFTSSMSLLFVFLMYKSFRIPNYSVRRRDYLMFCRRLDIVLIIPCYYYKENIYLHHETFLRLVALGIKQSR